MGLFLEPDFLEKLRNETGSVPLQVEHKGSMISEFYVLKASYMITIEECRPRDGILHYTAVTPGHKVETQVPLTERFLDWQRPLHQHNFMEVMYVLEGTVRQHLEDRLYEYRAGQCCILNTHMKHCEEFTTDFKAVFLMLSDEFLKLLCRTDFIADQSGGLRQRRSSIFSFFNSMLEADERLNKSYLDFALRQEPDRVVEEVRQLFEKLTRETDKTSPGSYLIAAGIIIRFFSVLEQKKNYQMEQICINDSRDRVLFARVARILEANGGRISRKELEQETNYNADYLNWIVRKHTGKNLTEYGQTFLLEQAERMLAGSELSVSAIIRELGITNRSYFYKLFEEKYGMTPKMFRETHREK